MWEWQKNIWMKTWMSGSRKTVAQSEKTRGTAVTEFLPTALLKAVRLENAIGKCSYSWELLSTERHQRTKKQCKCKSLAWPGRGSGQSTFDSIKDSISPKYKQTFTLFYRLRTELIWSLLSRTNNNSLSRSEDTTSLHSAVSSRSKRCTKL